MGSAAAYHLAARGQRVLGLEKFTPAHDQGSSHGGSRIIRQSYFEDPAYVPLLLRAYELWEQLATDSGREVYRLTGGLFIGPPDCLTVAGSQRASQKWDLPHEMLDAAEIRRRFPNFTPVSRRRRALRSQGRVRPAGDDGAGAHRPRRDAPARTCISVSRCIEWSETGGRCQRHHGARHLHRRAAGDLPRRVGAAAARRVRHPDHRSSARCCTGSTRVGGTAPFDDHPIFIDEERHTACRSTASPPSTARGGGVKVAFFRKGVVCTPGDHRPDGARRRRSPRCGTGSPSCCPRSTGRACTRRRACTPTRPTSTSSSPATRTPTNVTVACGFSGHGFKFVPVVGEILADLAIDGVTGHPISLFDPKRLVTT